MGAHRILVVDDEQHIVQVVRMKLQNAGYEVISAVDGEEGFEFACQHKPDLVITDFQMPYMTGLELCQAMAKEPATKNIPVIILTARGYALDDKDLQIGNITDVLSKPFSPRSILERVEEILQNAGDKQGSDGSADPSLEAA